MNCPRCHSKDIRKDGFANKKQRHLCKSCSFRFTVNQRNQKPINYKRIAVSLHLEGISNRAIKKILGVSDVAIMKWVKIYGNQPDKIQAKKTRINYLNIIDLKNMAMNKNRMFIVNVSNSGNDIYMLK